ncbi:MAG TPA: hypothetical protein VOB72_21180 [Candidatus Dormibacteraeota bacterium]|nr:hypothetical protein [Candidatus Dormibacteraeota bacterium]
MAKINANGARELARFAKGESRIVVTSDGRILRRLLAGDGYAVLTRIRDQRAQTDRQLVNAATGIASRLGYERTHTR